jgi:hypothetical protein
MGTANGDHVDRQSMVLEDMLHHDRLTVSLAEGNLGMGRKCAALENQSTTVSMVVLSSDGGRPLTKSNNIWDHGR